MGKCQARKMAGAVIPSNPTSPMSNETREKLKKPLAKKAPPLKRKFAVAGPDPE
jgi:hypothetical protein